MNKWIPTDKETPPIVPVADDTRCGISAYVLTCYIVTRGDGSVHYREYHVDQYRRGGRGDCEEEYWGMDWDENNWNGKKPAYWMPISPPDEEPSVSPPDEGTAAPELDGPTDNEWHYRPMEYPTRYPLELTTGHHICLWSEDGTYKWSVAYFLHDKDGIDLKFVGDRPLDDRVDWDHFRELVSQGFKILERKRAN